MGERDQSEPAEPRARSWLRFWCGRKAWAIELLVVVGLGAVFFIGAQAHNQRFNHKATSSDQSAYLSFAKHLATRSMYVDGARGPGYPLFLTAAYQEGATRAEFFERAKTLTVAATTLAWLTLWFLLRARLPFLQALVAWNAIGFFGLIHYAPYVKAEALYFVAITAAFLLLLRMLRSRSLKLGLACGLVLGAAYLMKSPALFLLVAFGLAKILKLTLELLRSRAPLRDRALAMARGVAPLTVVVLVILGMSSPLFWENQRKYGHALYNVNSSFYLWYDNWAEAKRGTRAHGDRVGWPDLPASELPSAREYFATHTAHQIIARIERGAKRSFQALGRRGVTLYLEAYALAVLFAALVRRRRAAGLLKRNLPEILLFSSFLGVTVLLAAWFEPISAGPRPMAAAVPVAFAALALTLGDLGKRKARPSSRRPGLGTVLALLIGLLLVVDVPQHLHRDFSEAIGGR